MTAAIKANLQLIYVSDMQISYAFYSKIFQTEAVFESPRYVAFDAGSDALFALWSGGEQPEPGAARFHEIGIMLPTDQDVDQLYLQWKDDADIDIESPPSTEIFGRTFLVKDPDGHRIRICSQD